MMIITRALATDGVTLDADMSAVQLGDWVSL